MNKIKKKNLPYLVMVCNFCSIFVVLNSHTYSISEHTKISSFQSLKKDTSSESLKLVTMPTEDVLESDETWVQSLKDSSESNTIKIFFSREASLVYQQTLLAINFILQNLESEKEKQIALFLNENTYNTSTKFSFKELENNKQIFFIKNSSDIDNNYNSPYGFSPNEDQMLLILDYYLKNFGEDIKFDIWLADLSIYESWNSNNIGWMKMLPYINHIYLLSDGNAQTFSFANDYIDRTKQKNYSDDEILNNLSTLMKKDVDETIKKEIYKNSSIFDFVRTNLFTLFHIERYVDSSYYDIPKEKMYTSYVINYDYFDLSNRLFTEQEQIKKENFILGYEKFFKIENSSLKNFVFDGFENYDPKKKNIIWMGDSLIREKAHVNEPRRNEIQKTFLALTKKYSPNEYNYFFKHHPYINGDQQKEMTNFIIGLSENVKPIYFDNFPWELFLSWDKYQQQTSSNYVPFFSSNSYVDEIPQTQLVGLQYTTTTILSTYSFITRQYKVNLDNAWKTVSNSNFPIGGTFHIVKRELPSQYEYDVQVAMNKEEIRKVYAPFLPLHKFPHFFETQITTKDFIESNNIDFDNDIKENDLIANSNEKFSFALNLSLSIIASVVVISIISGTTIYWFKKKRNKIG